MTQLVLTRPHTHAGKAYGVGDRIEIDATSADWLIAHDIAVAKVIQLQSFETAVQKHLDEAARAKGYAGVLSACSYAPSLNQRFGPEGVAFVRWRDAVWAYCYQAMNDVQAGVRAAPTTDRLIAELPALVI